MKRGWMWLAVFVAWLAVGWYVVLPNYLYEEVTLKCNYVNGVLNCQKKS